jgi:CheY-like chemotaxis protein
VKGEPAVILLVEDDPGHAELVRRGLEESGLAKRLMHVADGQAALDYLYRQAEFGNTEQSPRPGLVLLDLRLPKVDGLKVLQIIKSDPGLRRIPVVILTTSAAETDVAHAYDSHANSYLVKPMDFSQFEALMQALCGYWLLWNQHPG